MKKYALGVDIGGTTIKMGLFQSTGEILDVWEIPTRIKEDGKYILDDITKAVNDKLQEKQINKTDVAGIGVGVPGPISPDGEVLKCVNLGWGVFNVEKELSQKAGLPVKAGNDANVAALGEMWKGGGEGHENVVMVTLGTGVGGGIIINGKILPGITGAAGEIGHLPMQEGETECCGCGKKGCLEQYASASGIVRMTRKYLANEPKAQSKLREHEKITAKDIFDAAKEGDAAAILMVNEVGKMLGKALAQVACVVNPEVFVIGGGMAKAGDILLKVIRQNFVVYAFHACRNTEFKPAKLSNNAGICGGVKLVLN